MNTKSVKAFGTESATEPLKDLTIQRREVAPQDIEMEILYCGICHSDLHSVHNDWGGTVYPIVPGHEIVGRITQIGEGVSKFKVGELAGVGCIVDSCRECEHCHEDAAQISNCPKQDIILDTVSAKHDVNVYLNLLKVDSSLVMVGLPNEPLKIGAFNVVNGRKSFAGSNIGGIAETQEVIDFCAKHNIKADIELINIQDVNTAFERLEKGQVKYRFVIDMASL